MSKLILFILSLLSVFAISAQEIIWQNSYGGSADDMPSSITSVPDGGYVIAGFTESSDGDISINKGGADYWVVKINKLGVLQWEQTLGGSSKHDYANSVLRNHKDRFVIAGSSFSKDGDIKEKKTKGKDDVWVVFLKGDGKLKRHRNLGGFKSDEGQAIIQTKDDEYMLAGSTESNDQDVSGNHGKYDIWAAKLKKNGKLRWQVTLGGTEDDNAYDIKQTTDGGFILVGETASGNGNVKGHKGSYDFWVIKLSPEGKLMWQRCLGGANNDVAKSVIQTSDGGYVIAGETMSTGGDVSRHNGAVDIWVVKLSSTGNLIWEKTFGGSSFDYSSQIIESPEGGFVVIGTTHSKDGDVKNNEYNGTTGWVLKLNSVGQLKWQKPVGGNSLDELKSVTLNSAGNYVIAGSSHSNDGDLTPQQAKGAGDLWVFEMIDYDAGGGSGGMSARKKDIYNNVHRLDDEGYLAVGFTLNEGQEEALITRFDFAGNITWNKILGGSNTDIANAVIQLPSGKYWIAGETTSEDKGFQTKGGKDIFLMQVNKEGKQEWIKFFGGTKNELPVKMIYSRDSSHIILAASTESANGDINTLHGKYDYWVMQLDTTGKLIWEKTYGGTNIDMIKDIIITSDKNYMLAGYTLSSDGDVAGNNGIIDGWMVKIDSAGTKLWSKAYGGSKEDMLSSIIQTNDDGFFLTGSSASADGDAEDNYGGKDVWVIKTDKGGTIEWQKNIGGANNDIGVSVVSSWNGEGFVIAANTSSSDKDVNNSRGMQDIWMFMIDTKGKIQWQENYGDSNNDEVTKLIRTSKGAYLLIGQYAYSRANQEAWVEEYLE